MIRPTIFAVSSGRLPCGVAVIRISGPQARAVLRALSGTVPAPRVARLGILHDPDSGEILDRALHLFFPAPASATGEDVAELHVHGGRAVVAAILGVLGRLPGLRPAEAGAFTRRAHANGKMDLAEVEGLADLVAAETQAQRRQALAQMSGALSRRIETWREGLLRTLALIEASLDFSDEDDVSGDLEQEIRSAIAPVIADIAATLRDAQRGERVRDGLVVAIAGPPNAGKSSLLNRLAGRDAAIVSPVAGTTRDVLEIHLELAGQAVTLLDTAGLRDTVDMVEAEGVRRARMRAEAADMVLWLSEQGEEPPPALGSAIRVRTKLDLGGEVPEGWLGLSLVREQGVETLLRAIEQRADSLAGGEPALVTRERQRMALADSMRHLRHAVADTDWVSELRAEELRLAARCLDRVIGRIDVEDVLDRLFSTFCIGK